MSFPVWLKPIGVAAVLLAGGAGGYLYYSHQRDVLQADIASQKDGNSRYEQALSDRKRVDDALKRFASDTLGAQPDEADARFRTSLGTIAAGCGLSGVTVNTLQPEKVANPAGTKIKTPASLRNELQKQVDFSVIRGELNGQGSLDEVLRTVATVQNQPWVHRTESFSIKPLDKDHQRFSLALGVATILMPDLAPKSTPEPRIVPLDPDAGSRWAGIVSKNIFREPPLQVAKADVPPPPPPPPTPPPWGDWKLTAVVETHRRVEAWMVNTKAGGSVVLNVGSPVVGATFVGGSRDAATFEIDGQRYEVQIGQTLEQRSPASR